MSERAGSVEPSADGISEHEASASRADLAYVSDAEPGLRRRRSGKGFSYLSVKGKRLADAKVVARIDSLAIPPAWTDVWISPDPAGHIQATGRDQRGRKQYRYHPAWLTCRDEAKFSSLTRFAEALPAIRAKVDADLRRQAMPRERVVASVVWLLDNTMIRIGNDVYRRENKSFGLTTLRTRHVEIEGSSLRFAFVGKSGQEWKLKLADRRIARTVRAIQEIPGQHLFQYIDEDGARRAVHSHDVNDYIRAAAGPDFTSKHFRTWGGTVEAAMLFSETPRPETKSGAAREANRIIDRVAGWLNNTRAVCRRCYVHPAVIDAWDEGGLADELAAIRRRFRKQLTGLDAGESVILRWLRGDND